MTESRRLRTQADRATDDHVWRKTAASRPGYATWPDTRAGDPSWWRRGEPVDPDIWMTTENINDATTPPVDGETCKQWCGYCHLGPADERELARVRDAMDRAFAEPLDGPPRREPPPPLITEREPRRRWWRQWIPSRGDWLRAVLVVGIAAALDDYWHPVAVVLVAIVPVYVVPLLFAVLRHRYTRRV